MPRRHCEPQRPVTLPLGRSATVDQILCRTMFRLPALIADALRGSHRRHSSPALAFPRGDLGLGRYRFEYVVENVGCNGLDVVLTEPAVGPAQSRRVPLTSAPGAQTPLDRCDLRAQFGEALPRAHRLREAVRGLPTLTRAHDSACISAPTNEYASKASA